MLNKLIAIKIKNRIKLINHEINNPINYQNQTLDNQIKILKKNTLWKRPQL